MNPYHEMFYEETADYWITLRAAWYPKETPKSARKENNQIKRNAEMSSREKERLMRSINYRKFHQYLTN
jgi:hypothetical protein